MTMYGAPPPSELIFSVIWLGKLVSQSEAMPIGSGTIVRVDGADYVVTAFHVFQQENCPLARMEGQWYRSNAVIIAFDQDLDIAVLRCPAQLRSPDLAAALDQGIANLAIGTPGLALGFPDVLDPSGTKHVLDHVAEINGRPIPLPSQALYYVGQSGLVGQSGAFTCSGYTNAGYSGGLLAFPNPGARKWCAAGVIVGFPRVWRSLQLPEGSLSADSDLKSQEHMGLIHAVTINEVEAIVREGRMPSSPR